MDENGRQQIIIPAGTVIRPSQYFAPVTSVASIVRQKAGEMEVMLGPGEFAWITGHDYEEVNFDKDGKLIEP